MKGTEYGVAEVRRIFELAPFIREIGATLLEVAPGRVVSAIDTQPKLTQHHGVLHAGVSATLADHTAGAAATTLLEAGTAVLTVEFKINLLRAITQARIECVAQVLRAGRSITVVESEVFGIADGKRELVAKAMVTLATVAGR